VLDRDRISRAQPPVVIVLLVEHGLPAGRDLRCEILDRDLVDSVEVFGAHVVGHPVALPHPNVDDRRVEARLFAEFARRGFGEHLALLDDASDHVPVIVDGAMEHEVLVAASDDDRGLACRPQSAATAACSFAVASPAGVPAGK